MYRLIILLILTIASQAKADYHLSICAIFKNEAPFLKEWIEFHKLQGVEHFYLYNNNSTDNFLEVLEPYVDSNEVTLIDWSYTYEPGKTNEWLRIQMGSYTDCLKNFGQDTTWLAVIDIDEFLFCPSGESLTFFNRYTQYGAVCANWLQFGTSNIATIPEGYLMIELLTRCSKLEESMNQIVKTIVQPKYTDKCLSTHSFSYIPGYFAVDARGEKVSGMRIRPVNINQIRVNHYWTRTEQYFVEKKCQSRQNRRRYENEANLRKRAETYNLSEDFAILRFVPALKERMGISIE